MSRIVKLLIGTAAFVALATAAIAGCGGSSSSNPVSLKVGIGEQGKEAVFTAPKSIEGGLVELTVTNEGKAPHGVQLIRYTGGHTPQEVLEIVSGETKKIPDWIRGEGGIGGVEPGKTASGTLNLEAGNFLIADSEMEGKSKTAEMKVTEGDEGDLPSTEGTVTAEEKGEDEYAWDISGLKAGKNQITFNAEGEKALHLIIAVPLKGKVPPLSQIKKEIGKNGPPPSYIDFEGGVQSTAVLDGGKSQTTPLNLKSGEYLFFCPLTDRDGGKSHDQEGLLAVEKVQ
jgi:hypothetical protein